MPPDAPGRYAVAQLEGLDVAAVASGDAAAGPATGPPVWNTYVWVDDVEATAVGRWNVPAGPCSPAPSTSARPGGWPSSPTRPERALRLWQAGTNRGPGSSTPPARGTGATSRPPTSTAARAFYAAVFGWEVVDVDIGGSTATMCRLPGYGDFLERLEPGLRSRQAADGVPPGFADAIAWMMPAADGHEARWSVTFAVDDTDAVVRRAVELGGEVRVAAFDAGPVRAADLADPQGAVFSVNSYDPGRS